MKKPADTQPRNRTVQYAFSKTRFSGQEAALLAQGMAFLLQHFAWRDHLQRQADGASNSALNADIAACAQFALTTAAGFPDARSGSVLRLALETWLLGQLNLHSALILHRLTAHRPRAAVAPPAPGLPFDVPWTGTGHHPDALLCQ